MSKLPFVKYFPADWLVDTRTLTVAERGAWHDLCCVIWIKSKDGSLTMSLAEFACLWNVPEAEAQAILEGLSAKGVCNASVTEALREYGKVTVTSRRIERDKKELNNNAIRQRRYREKHARNVDITDKKSEVRSQKGANDAPPPTPQTGGVAAVSRPKAARKNSLPAAYDDPGFVAFWDAYPRHDGKLKAAQAWDRLAPDETLRAEMMEKLEEHKTADQWTKDGGQFVPHAATWLNQRRWEDELGGGGRGWQY